MSDEVFVNVYIEKILTEVSELTKSKLLLQAQLSFTEKVAAELGAKLQDLEKKLEESEEKLKKKKKDTDTY